MIEIIILIVIGLIWGWREVQNVIHKLYYEHYESLEWKPSYWNYDSFNNWFWWTPYKSWKKNFDSFHFLVGLMAYIICLGINSPLDSIHWLTDLFGWASLFLIAVVEWLWIMYWRNVMMHVILPLKGYKRLWYLVPLLGGWLENVSKKSTY